jgi:hypothetical protein
MTYNEYTSGKKLWKLEILSTIKVNFISLQSSLETISLVLKKEKNDTNLVQKFWNFRTRGEEK